MKNLILILAFLISFTASAKVTTILNHPENIWGITKLNNTTLLFTEKKGQVFKFDIKTKKIQKLPIKFPGLYVSGQGGLLDILYSKGRVYFTYSFRQDGKNTTRLVSIDYKDNEVSSFKTLFTANAFEKTRHHYGSRLHISENKIYMTVGDRGKRDKAQSLDSHHGKVLRLNLDGSIPADNPFKGSAIFSLGHRNPQGISQFKSYLYNGEFGPQGGDEINLLKAGGNYGWPLYTYGEEYGSGKIKTKLKIDKRTKYIMPYKYWAPSLSFSDIVFHKDNLYLACLGTKQIIKLDIRKNKLTNQEKVSQNLEERFRALEVMNDKVYFATDQGTIGFIQ
jgi:glucose/arabinose dehydrogenase